MQQQQAQDMNQANQWGQGSLGQQISTAGYMGGTMLGRGLQGLGQAAGIIPEDPRIAEARKLQEVTKEIQQEGIDPSDPIKFYDTLSRKLADRGLTEQSLQMSVKAADLKMKQLKNSAEIGKLDAERVKALRDKESGVAQVQREITEAVGRGDVNAAMELQKKLDALILPESVESEEGAGTLTVDGKQVPAVRKLIVSKDGKQVLWRGQPYARGGGVTVNTGKEPEPSPFDIEYQKLDAKRAADITRQAQEAPAKVANLRNLLSASQGAVSGSFPQFQVALVRGLQTLGFADPKLNRMLTDSDFFTQNANEAVLTAIGGSLGAQISNSDREFVAAIVPQLQSSPEARKKMIEWLEAKAKYAIDTGDAWEKHYSDYIAANPKNRKQSPMLGFRPPEFKFNYNSGGASKKSSSISTYDQWRAWATANGYNPDEFNREEVEARLRQRNGQ
jgi:hypothetical protein